jgi:hypothetical protein
MMPAIGDLIKVFLWKQKKNKDQQLEQITTQFLVQRTASQDFWL